MPAPDMKKLLGQLLAIKKCREAGLRNRARRLDEEIRQCRTQQDAERNRQREVRVAWRSASDSEHQVGPRDFPRLKRMFADFYRDEQQIQAGLRRIDSQIAERRAAVADTSRALRENLRGQEKLNAVVRETK